MADRQSIRFNLNMKIFARNVGRIVGTVVAVLTLALAFHYYVRLLFLENTVVVIQPGKWVWVECQTHEFSATIEEVGASGIVVSVGAPVPKGVPCEAVGLVAQGDHRYFLPFRTVLGVRVSEQRAWSNPFPM